MDHPLCQIFEGTVYPIAGAMKTMGYASACIREDERSLALWRRSTTDDSLPAVTLSIPGSLLLASARMNCQ